MSDLTDIQRRLPRLSQAELATLAKQVEFLIKPPTATTDDWLFEGLVLELRRRGLLDKRPTLQFVYNRYPRYKKESDEVRQVLLRAVDYRLRPPELLRLGTLAARAMLDDIEKGPAPVCLQTVVQQVSRLPGVVDSAFPGYISSGLIGALINTQSVSNHGRSAAVTSGINPDHIGIRRKVRRTDRGSG